MAGHVDVSVTDGVARLLLNRPEKRNALSLEMMTEVTDALGALGADPEVQVIVIAGAGKVFSAGHDMTELIDREDSFYLSLFTKSAQMMEAIHALPQPVIAQVHGIATAAGCQLVASCDLVVSADDALFATPGVKIGLFCSTPMVPISRAIGRKRAMEMLLTGEFIDASTAMDWGLVNRIAPADELDEAVETLVNQITRYSSDVIAVGKDAFYRQIELDEHGAYEYAQGVMASNAAGDDAQEGMGAFLEKREPVWATGRAGQSQ